MAAFANFLNDQSLNEQQISFVKRVVNYVVENGYMEPVALTQPPFDRPQSFIRMFNSQQQLDLMAVIKGLSGMRNSPPRKAFCSMPI